MPVSITADPEVRQKSILRRYMDLPKLLDLLHTNSLYVRRADGFSDRLEGALFPSLRKSLDGALERGEVPYDADYFYRRSRTGNYVSCWSIGARDNMALWQLYGGVKTSIAVTSTVDRLLSCALAWNKSTHLFRVKYVDHRHVKDYVIGGYMDVLGFKSDAYKYERELRVVVPEQGETWERNPTYLRLALPSVDSLVRSIVVAPEAEPEYVEAVRELCKRYNLKAPVRRSSLSLVQV